MQRSWSWMLPLALFATGCIDEELQTLPTQVSPTVQLSRRDPGPACRVLDSIEVCSNKSDCPTPDALRDYASGRGANYVVLDTFTVLDETDAPTTLTRARLFSCPPLVAVYQ